MATIVDLEKYRMENGRYDVEAIIADEKGLQYGSLESTFASFFGGESELVDLARSENERMANEEGEINQAEINSSLRRFEDGSATNADYNLLAGAGYGYLDNSDENGPMQFVYTGKKDGDVYNDWKEEDMIGTEL